MPFNSVVTPDDLKKGELIKTPGIKPIKFAEYKENPAKGDQSTNLQLIFEIIDGDDKGINLYFFLNEKALGFGKTLWDALGIPFEPGFGYRLSDTIIKSKLDTKLKCMAKRGKNKDTGKDINVIDEFLPWDLSSAV